MWTPVYLIKFDQRLIDYKKTNLKEEEKVCDICRGFGFINEHKNLNNDIMLKSDYTSYEQKAGGFNHPDECSFKKF